MPCYQLEILRLGWGHWHLSLNVKFGYNQVEHQKENIIISFSSTLRPSSSVSELPRTCFPTRQMLVKQVENCANAPPSTTATTDGADGRCRHNRHSHHLLSIISPSLPRLIIDIYTVLSVLVLSTTRALPLPLHLTISLHLSDRTSILQCHDLAATTTPSSSSSFRTLFICLSTYILCHLRNVIFFCTDNYIMYHFIISSIGYSVWTPRKQDTPVSPSLSPQICVRFIPFSKISTQFFWVALSLWSGWCC